MPRIPVAAPDLGGNEERYVIEAIRSTWIASSGPFVERFEREFAEFCDTRAAIGTANGTVALHLAMVALGLEPGDEVIVPSLTYIATANAVRYAGGVPVFADVDTATWCLDPAAVAAAVTPKTRGIIAVHLYGHPADMDALNDLAARHGLWVVEDAAEAHGATYKGRVVGGLGSMATFSFYGNKILTSGEGGAITLDDPDLERRVRLFRGQGMDPERRYFFPVVGYNYRLTNLACALLCAQLERFDAVVRRRRAVFEMYGKQLASIEGIGFQPVADWAGPAHWMYSITVDEDAFGMSRDRLTRVLANGGIETRPFFHPIHRLPPYEGRPGADCPLPVTDRLASTGVNLPTSSVLRDEDIRTVTSAIWAASRGEAS